MVVLSVWLLLDDVGSVTPVGAVTDAVLEIEPVAAGLMVPMTVYVMTPSTGILTKSLILPVPLGWFSVALPSATEVQVGFWKLEGKLSTTRAPVTGLGPRLRTTIV